MPVDLAAVAQAHVADGYPRSLGVAAAVGGEAAEHGAHDAAVSPAGAVRAADPLLAEVPRGVVGARGGEEDAVLEAAGTR